MFKATILNPKRTLFEKDVFSVFLPGTEGEFEVMQFHKPLIALLKSGHIIINWEEILMIRKGVVMVNQNGLVAMVEE
jgi:F0F1-type ATP synthase epsilon subunit